MEYPGTSNLRQVSGFSGHGLCKSSSLQRGYTSLTENGNFWALVHLLPEKYHWPLVFIEACS